MEVYFEPKEEELERIVIYKLCPGCSNQYEMSDVARGFDEDPKHKVCVGCYRQSLSLPVDKPLDSGSGV